MSEGPPRIDGKRPIMALLDLLSQRWALRLLWELSEGARTSRALREATAISPTVLQTRLDALRAARIVEHGKGEGYRLTATGEALIASFAPLYAFAADWAAAMGEQRDGLDPAI
jgi:DNA-binding HxlR family transcriptional regulator